MDGVPDYLVDRKDRACSEIHLQANRGKMSQIAMAQKRVEDDQCPLSNKRDGRCSKGFWQTKVIEGVPVYTNRLETLRCISTAHHVQEMGAF